MDEKNVPYQAGSTSVIQPQTSGTVQDVATNANIQNVVSQSQPTSPIASPYESLDGPEASITSSTNPVASSVSASTQVAAAPQTITQPKPTAFRDKDTRKMLTRLVAGALVVMLLLFGAGMISSRLSDNRIVDPVTGIEEQDIASLAGDGETLGVKTTNTTLLVNGNVLAVGDLQVSNGTAIGTVALEDGGQDQTYTLPNASGVFCLDINNCGYLQADDITTTTIAGVDGALTLGEGLAINGSEISSTITQTAQTSVNNSTGSITLQGTNNQVTVTKNGNTLTLSGPQDLGVTSSPTFDSITLTNPGTQNGNVICDISNNCGYAGGTGAFIQDGNSFGAGAMLGTNDNFSLSFETNGTERMSILNDGRVGINNTNPTYQFDVIGSSRIQGHAAIGADADIDDLTLASGADTYSVVLSVEEEITNFTTDYVTGSSSSLLLNPSADSDAIVIASSSTLTTDASSGFDFNDQVIGATNSVFHGGTGDITSDAKATTSFVFNLGAGGIRTAWGSHAAVVNTGSGTIQDVNVGTFHAFNLGSGTISDTVKLLTTQFDSDNGSTDTVYGLQVASNTGTITNNYGIYVQDQSGAGSTNSYNLYSAGANSLNQFEGRLRIADGTVASPSIAFTSDTDTGIYRTGSNQIAISTGGANNTTFSTAGVDIQGRVTIGDGAGTPSSAAALYVVETFDSSDSFCTFGCYGAQFIAIADNPLANNGLAALAVQAQTAATAFVQTNVTGLFVGNASAGAGSTINNAYGIRVNDQTGATNNYGIAIGTANTQALWIGNTADSTTASNGIGFGISRDTNLYRSAANTLRTDDALSVGSTLSVTTLGTADSLSYLCSNTSNQLATCSSTGTGAMFIQGGNSFGATAILGTNDSNSLTLETNNTTQATLAVGGAFTLQNSTDSTSGFRVMDADGGNPVLNVDTTNERVGIGTATPTVALEVTGDSIISNRLQVGATGNTIDECSTLFFGNISCDVGLDVANTSTTATTATYGIYNNTTLNSSASNGATNYASANNLYVSGTNNYTVSNIGVSGATTITNTSGTVTRAVGLEGTAGILSTTTTATLTEAMGVYAGVGVVSTVSGGTVTTGYGIYVSAATVSGTGATMGSNYGIYVNPQTTGTSDYGVAIGAADTQTLWLSSNADNTTAAAGIAFGSSRDTNLYRSAANTLRTDDALSVGDDITVTGDVLPSADDTYDLGSNSNRWRDLYLGPATLSIGTSSTDYKISYDTVGNSLLLNNDQADRDFRIAGVTQANLLYVDAGNNRIGIGTNAPGYELDVAGTLNASSGLRVNGTQVCTSSGCTAAAGSGNYIQNGTSIQSSANLAIQSAAAGSIGAVVRGATSQSANLQEWQNSSGTALATITASGGLTAQTIALNVVGANNGDVIHDVNNSGTAIFRITKGNGYTTTRIYSQGSSSSSVGLAVIGAASQSANLQEWQNSSNTVMTAIAADGDIVSTEQISVGNMTPLSGVRLSVYTNTDVKGLAVRGSGSQTANLQEWQNSSGTVLSAVNASGKLTIGTTVASTGDIRLTSAASIQARNAANTGDLRVAEYNGSDNLVIGGGTAAGITAYTGTGSMMIQNSSTSAITLITRGAASQSANLQEWQNSSGTALASVTSAGAIQASTYFTFTGDTDTSLYRNAADQFRINTGGTDRLQLDANSLLTNVRLAVANTISAGGPTFGTAEKFRVNTPTTIDNAASSIFATGGTTAKGIVIQGVSSQTANLQEWQDSTGAVMTSITSNGSLAFGATTASAGTIRLANNGSIRARNSGNTGDAILMQFSTSDVLNIGTNNNQTGINIGSVGGGTGAIGFNNANFGSNAISIGATFAFGDGFNLSTGTTTGTKFGTATTQKLSFFNATPITQPTSTTDLRTAMINLGLLASGGATPLSLNGGALTVGDASVTGTLVVTGAATFNNTLTVNGHVITGNTSGSTSVAVNTAGAGTGATASISGNDTSGVITINTGTGAAAGTLGTVTFANSYGSAPKVIITPKAIPGGGIYPQYHFDSGTTTFDLKSFNALTDSSTYTFSYMIVQ